MTEASLRIGHRWRLYKPERWFSSHQQLITLSLYALSLLLRSTMASNDNNNCKWEEAEESVAAMKRLRVFADDDGGNDSSSESEEDTEADEVSLEKESMN
jgi:hypothetical protein